MKYILLIYGDEQAWAGLSKEEMEAMYAGHQAYGEALTKAGVEFSGSELKPAATATSLRFNGNGRPKMVDGPFAETKEQLAGYYVIDVENLERALEWGEKMPGMMAGTVEVRPLA
jgi:hypothetical protein